jgi:hypothetical protein
MLKGPGGGQQRPEDTRVARVRSVDVNTPVQTSAAVDITPGGGPVAPSVVATARRVRRESLINRLNFLHFQSAPLTVLLKHRQNGRSLRLACEPQPCSSDELTCYWSEPLSDSVLRGDFILRHMEVPNGNHVLQVLVEEVVFSEDGLTCRLPEDCRELAMRKIKRHFCQNIEARIIQNGTTFTGELVDFSAAAFRLDLHAQPPQTFHWLDSTEPVTLILNREGHTQLIIDGRILRRHGNRQQQTVVVFSELAGQHRFPTKKHRSRRMELCPAPMAVFTHPLTGRTCRLDVMDISGAGFGVIEDPQEAQLLPGMSLHDLELRLSDSFKLHCQAQVVYSKTESSERDSLQLRSGIAILDMTITDHTQLMALLHRAENRRKGVCPYIDIDRLWEFFFDSGFIYPQKYRSLQEYRREFKQTYLKLYARAPEIARHFVYRENNRIIGHMAMLRTHSNAWLIHHHAADRTRSRQAGLQTLQLVGEAVNESQGIYSSHMDYVMCYFRPENRFPQRVFGGVASHYDDPSACSVDTLSYFHYEKKFDLHWKDNGPWELAPAKNEDLLNLEAFYRKKSGGLMLHGLDLTPERPDEQELNTSYEMAGFQRHQSLFALRRKGATVAVFTVLRTEVGLNLSNLTNAISVIILDQQALPREAFFTAISMLASKFPQKKIPILAYPKEYVVNQAINIEKHYNLWVLDCRNLDPYFEFCNALFNHLKQDKREVGT